MVSEHERFAAFQKMVRESTDPQWVRQQLAQPHQYSRTFIVVVAIIGFLAGSAIFAAAASI